MPAYCKASVHVEKRLTQTMPTAVTTNQQLRDSILSGINRCTPAVFNDSLASSPGMAPFL